MEKLKRIEFVRNRCFGLGFQIDLQGIIFVFPIYQIQINFKINDIIEF